MSHLALALSLVTLAGACGETIRPLYPIDQPTTALSTHNDARSKVAGIRAEARVDQRGVDGRIRGTVLMFVQRPGKVRFDVMTQFGPVAILTSDGEEFAYADLRKRSYLSGPTCPANIARLLGIPMSVQDTTLLLLGGTPLIRHDSAEIGWNEDGVYRLELAGPAGRQVVDFGLEPRDVKARPEAQRLQLLRSEVYGPSGKTMWRITYEDYRAVDGADMPFKVRVQQPGSGADTLIRFKDIVITADAPAEAFTQRPRPGMKQEVAVCD